MISILLTGGSGFIGRNLLELLTERFKITAPSHDALDLTNAQDVKEFFKKNRFDMVIHAAGVGSLRTQSNSAGVYELNYKIFRNLTEHSKCFGRMIFFGSGAEYGKQQPIIKAKESDCKKVLPEDEYGRSKCAISEYIAQHEQIANLRCFGVFGKYEDYRTRFISNIICQSLAGKAITVKQNAVFDYIYINDLAKIVEYFLVNEPKEKFYNIGSGQGIELLSIARIVKELTANPHEIVVEQTGLGREYTCDNSKLLGELGNFEFTSINSAISELIEWYRKNWQSIDQRA